MPAASSVDLAAPNAAPVLEVNISADLALVDVMHDGRMVRIMRNQDQDHSTNPEYTKTSRKCPPFCIQPSELAPGVKTIAELEVLQHLKKVSDGDASMLVIDSRTPAWVEKGIIPGTVNIPWDTLVFAGGIGENEPIVRSRICAGLGFLGIELDEKHNAANEDVISAVAGRVAVRVMRTNEELTIARSVCRVLDLGAST